MTDTVLLIITIACIIIAGIGFAKDTTALYVLSTVILFVIAVTTFPKYFMTMVIILIVLLLLRILKNILYGRD